MRQVCPIALSLLGAATLLAAAGPALASTHATTTRFLQCSPDTAAAQPKPIPPQGASCDGHPT
jgi:hypothetical protein